MECTLKRITKAFAIYVVMHRLWFVFIVTGMIQMVLGRWIGVHNGLDHMVFSYWWQYALEGLFYSLCHSGMYYYFKNGA
jgi:hypothetical protein